MSTYPLARQTNRDRGNEMRIEINENSGRRVRQDSQRLDIGRGMKKKGTSKSKLNTETVTKGGRERETKERLF